MADKTNRPAKKSKAKASAAPQADKPVKRTIKRPNPPPAIKLEPLGPTGRPQTYQDEFCEIVYRLGLLGLTDAELAGFFGVSEQTITDWEKAHPEFLGSRARAREDADGKVARALLHRAMGYHHPDVHITSYEGQVTMTPIVKHYPPDTQAASWWLKNRQPTKWRDKVEVESSGTLTVTTVNYADT